MGWMRDGIDVRGRQDIGMGDLRRHDTTRHDTTRRRDRKINIHIKRLIDLHDIYIIVKCPP